ncbi:MAG: 16S rRNA (adenine(1518)-N(6)/adenine(1519)-N(6))-dimethyltransferase RsmA [Thermoplasmataceae archaeon]
MSQERGFSKKYGQVFLKNSGIATFEANLLGGIQGSKVLEIGPGEGMLTRKLLDAGFNVTAIEPDHRYVEYMQGNFTDEIREGRLQIIKADFLKTEIKPTDYIAGNVPYQISSPIVEKLRKLSFQKAVIMVQEEFGQRMCAKSGMDGYSKLSLMTSLCFDCKLERKVSRKNFVPVPNVDSAIISMVPKPWDYGINYEIVDEIARKLFSQRRKKISSVLGIKIVEYSEKRVEELSPDEFIRMCHSLNQNSRNPC